MLGFIDICLRKIVSRKLFVFAISCWLASNGWLDSSDWVVIAGIYIGGQTVIDSIERIKGV
jgi:hypothetical protein